MKRFVIILVAFIALLLIAVVGVYIYIDQIAKTGIERGASFALGVPTTVEHVTLQPFAGQLQLQKLSVGNPDGFSADHFLTLNQGDLTVSLTSLRRDVVHVPRLRLRGADIVLERDGDKANYRVILENLRKLQPQQPGDAKRFIIDDLVIRNVDVHVNVLGSVAVPGGNTLGAVGVPVDNIRLRDVGAEHGRGVTISELSGIILQTVLTSALEKGAGLIPDDMQRDLNQRLSQLADLRQLVRDIDLGELRRKAEELGLPKDIADQAAEQIEDAADRIGEVLDGDEKSQPR